MRECFPSYAIAMTGFFFLCLNAHFFKCLSHRLSTRHCPWYWLPQLSVWFPPAKIKPKRDGKSTFSLQCPYLKTQQLVCVQVLLVSAPHLAPFIVVDSLECVQITSSAHCVTLHPPTLATSVAGLLSSLQKDQIVNGIKDVAVKLLSVLEVLLVQSQEEVSNWKSCSWKPWPGRDLCVSTSIGVNALEVRRCAFGTDKDVAVSCMCSFEVGRWNVRLIKWLLKPGEIQFS